MSDKESNISDQILDLLLDALQERQQKKSAEAPPPMMPEVEKKSAYKPPEPPAAPLPAPIEPVVEVEEPEAEVEDPRPEPMLVRDEAAVSTDEHDEQIEELKSEPLPPVTEAPVRSEVPGVNLDRMLRRLFLVMILLVVIINIPFNKYGTNLARAMPDSAALIIRNGLLLKGSGDKVYVLDDNMRRWITTLDAFEEYGYRWSQVHVVDDEFLEDFEEGLPIHLLLKCETSPHIYALEDGEKRWIKDIPTFEAQKYVWEDIRFVSCNYLRDLPDGPPIPEDAGPPPQP